MASRSRERQPKKLINAMFDDDGPEGVEMAVLLFSGPRSWAGYRSCEASYYSVSNAACGMNWRQHFTRDKDQLIDAVDTCTWPGGITWTNFALSLAAAELNSGRPDAEPIILAITDGKPSWYSNTIWVANQIKSAGVKIEFVPVQKVTPETFNPLASEPTSQNVMYVDKFEELSDQSVLDKIVSTTCEEIGSAQA